MGLQINKPLTMTTGGTIPSGNIVAFEPRFPAGTKFVRFQPVYNFISIQARDDWYNNVEGADPPVLTKNIKDMLGSYDYEMTDEEYAALNTATGVMDIIQGYLKDQIVANSNGYLTDGDIQVVN